MTCSECSAELSVTASRCRACGTPRGAVKAAPAAASTSAPPPTPSPTPPPREAGGSSVLGTIGTIVLVVLFIGVKAVVRYERRHRNDSNQRYGR